MSNTYWNPLIERIQSESHRCNKKTVNAISQVTVRIILHDGHPIMWEVIGSNKIEPTSLLTETIGRMAYNIGRLSRLCTSPEQVNQIIEKLVDKLSKKHN